MVSRQDDPTPIPHDHIRFLGQSRLHLLREQICSHTDSGATWSTWEGDDKLFKEGEGDYYVYRYPRNVEIAADGTGVMTSEPIEKIYGPPRRFRTEDLWATLED